MSADASATPSQTASPLSVPIFRAVWLASMSSNFGALIQSVGASWMMTSLAGSPEMIALVQTSTSLPIMLLSLWAGAIADNLDRRKVMLAAQSFMLLVSLTLAIAAWMGLMTPWLLLSLTFLIGCGTALNSPAWQASVGDMVPRAALPNAVALNSMGFNIARSVGPAIGGAIVAAAGAAAAFALNAASYIALIGVLLRWRPDLPERVLPREKLGVAMRAGLRYVSMSPHILRVLLRAALFGVGASAISAMMPLVARDIVRGGAFTYGLLLGCFGLGAVAGAIGSGWLRRHLSEEWRVRLASAALAAGAATTGTSPYLPVTLFALALAGGGWVIALSSFNVSVQMSSPRWVAARALAVYQMVVFGAMAGGSWMFGIIAEHRGPVFALHVAALLLLVAVFAGLVAPLESHDDENLDLLGRWREPDTAVRVSPRSGPIVVTIEHRVPPENIAAFLTVMEERRRIRRRDGARGWTLMRDLGDPELWVERYDVATWLDYVRHNQRRTFADAPNSEELRSLRMDEGEPVVRRLIERQTGTLPFFGRALGPRELADPLTDPTRSN